jgi:hypothetical protein
LDDKQGGMTGGDHPLQDAVFYCGISHAEYEKRVSLVES